jgi:hypothetical protein
VNRHSLLRSRAARLALLIAISPAVAACTIHTPNKDNNPQGPEPTQGPFASAGTETVPAIP